MGKANNCIYLLTFSPVCHWAVPQRHITRSTARRNKTGLLMGFSVNASWPLFWWLGYMAQKFANRPNSLGEAWNDPVGSKWPDFGIWLDIWLPSKETGGKLYKGNFNVQDQDWCTPWCQMYPVQGHLSQGESGRKIHEQCSLLWTWVFLLKFCARSPYRPSKALFRTSAGCV